ncbi:putative membrane protein, partial [Yersinia pestis PY-14]
MVTTPNKILYFVFNILFSFSCDFYTGFHISQEMFI